MAQAHAYNLLYNNNTNFSVVLCFHGVVGGILIFTELNQEFYL